MLHSGWVVKEPSERLGSDEKGGVAGVKKAAFFKSFDFGALERRTMLAPFVPTVDSPTDTRNCRGEADIFEPETDKEASEEFAGQELHTHFPEWSRIDEEEAASPSA